MSISDEIRAVDEIRGHKFLPWQLSKTIPEMMAQEDADDPMVFASYFHPMSPARWLVLEYGAESGAAGTFFGYADMFGGRGDGELGYTDVAELGTVLVRGLPVERDCSFTPAPLSEVKARLGL